MLIKEYPVVLYFLGWVLSLYPMILGWVYYLRHKTNVYHFEFKPLKLRDSQF